MNQPPRSRSRVTLISLCAVSIVLAVASLSWWFAATRERQVTTLRTVHASPTTVPISGCATNVGCRLDAAVRPAVLALIQAQFGPNSITSSAALVNAETGARYEENVQVDVSPGIRVQVTTRCVDGAAASPSSSPASVPATGPVSLVAVTAGHSGCSAAVAMQVHGSSRVPWSQALAVVDSPTVQLDN